MIGDRPARSAFALAIALLLLCAALVCGAFVTFATSERWVQHTQEVREALGETESNIAAAARERLIYVLTGDADALARYHQGLIQIPNSLKRVRQLTADNPTQQHNCDRLENLANTRIQLWEKSIALKKNGKPDPMGQPEVTRQSLEFANDIVAVMHAMGGEEVRLLKERSRSVRFHFLTLISSLLIALVAAVLLLLWHYRLLRAELRGRKHAERVARESELKAHEAEHIALASRRAVGQLSIRLLKLQDDERRRLSRELHDSIGQYLAAAKMIVSSFVDKNDSDQGGVECIKLLDQAIREIRTISHLLHPPGLDEVGFSSAARWYAEEFGKRSGLQLKINVAELPNRLLPAVEIALFRVLQESLTNIHRHAKSTSAEVLFEITSGQATLAIIDRGIGVPSDVLSRFQTSGTSGVGLAGMRERIRELDGKFEVDSNGDGTRIQVTVPLQQYQAFSAEQT